MSTEILRTRLGVPEGIVYWVLAFDYAGKVWYFSDTELDIPYQGGVLRVESGLSTQVQLEQRLSLFSSGSEGVSLSIDLYFPESIAAIIARGYSLTYARAKLYYYVDGSNWADAVPVVGGVVLDPVYGDESEPVSFTLSQTISDDTAVIIPVTQTVSSSTWADAADAALGRLYPLVFGSPGVISSSQGTKNTSGSPALFVDTVGSRLLIAGHHVLAGQVRITDDANAEDFPVINTVDALNQPVALVDISGASTITIDETQDYYVVWNNGGGLVNPQNPQAALELGGDLLLYILGKSSITIDTPALSALQAKLNGYVFAGFIDDTVSPLAWTQANLLPTMPVSLISSPGGLSGVLWDYDSSLLQHAKPAWVLNTGITAERVSPVNYQSSNYGTFKVDYGLRKRTGDFLAFQIRTYNRDSSDPNQSGGAYCQAAYNRITRAGGKPGVKAVSSSIIYNGVTAGKWLSWLERAYALETRSVSYSVPIRDSAGLELGARGLVYDTDLSWAGVWGRVEAISINNQIVTVEVRILDDLTV